MEIGFVHLTDKRLAVSIEIWSCRADSKCVISDRTEHGILSIAFEIDTRTDSCLVVAFRRSV